MSPSLERHAEAADAPPALVTGRRARRLHVEPGGRDGRRRLPTHGPGDLPVSEAATTTASGLPSGAAPVGTPAGPPRRSSSPSSVVRRARVGILVPGSGAERAARSVVWCVVLAVLIAGSVWPQVPPAAALAGWSLPVLGVLLGYRRDRGLRLKTVAERAWLTLGRPYVAWLLLLGAPVLTWEFSRSTGLGIERAVGLLWGGIQVQAPLSGHWLLAALAFAVLMIAAAERWLAVDPVWLLPAALAITHEASAVAALPLGVGLGAACVTFVLLGHLLRRARERLGWRAGLVLGGLGLAVVLGPWESLDLRAGQGGPALLGPLAAGAAAAGLILVAERGVRLLPPGFRHGLAEAERLAPVALLTFGIGPYVVPDSWPQGVAAAAALLVAVLACAAIAGLRRSAWLTGTTRPQAPISGRHARRRFAITGPTTVGA